MNPLTHLLAGWLAANTVPLSRRDRTLVTLSGVIPDIDGLGIIADLATRGSPAPLDWYWRFHHTLGHNLAFGLVVTTAAFCLAWRRGSSPVELVSRRADTVFVDTLRARFGVPTSTCEPSADVA